MIKLKNINTSILYLSNSIVPSSNANTVHVLKMCDTLSNNRRKVTLFCLSNKDGIDQDFINSTYNLKNKFNIINLFIKKNRIGIIKFYLFSFYQIITKSFDLIYCKHPFFLFPIIFSRKNFILEIHDLRIFNRFFFNFLYNLILRSKNLKKIIVITNQLKFDLIKIYPFVEDKIEIVHDAAIVYDKSKVEISKTINKTFKFNIIYVGSLHEGKGIEIIEKLIFKFKDFGFHIVGGTGSKLNYWIDKLNEHKNIFFYGHLPHSEVTNFIIDSDICLLPNQKKIKISNSKNKFIEIGKYTSPLKLFEYMSLSKPIIASNLLNIREVLKNNYNSILCDCDNIELWFQAIETLYNNSELRTYISKNAYNDFVHNYTWDIRIKKILLNL